MQVLGMYGYVDKYDFVIAIARTINIMSRSVLVIDATNEKKYKYIVPSIDNSEKYITQYGEIDFAVGFESSQDLGAYLTEKNIDMSKYSYVILDIDSANMYEKFYTTEADKSFLFIASNLVSVNKTEELVKTMRAHNAEKEISFTKIYYHAYTSRAAENYLEERISNYGINYTQDMYDIVNDEQDNMIHVDSQYSGFIDIRRHTKNYLIYLSELVSKIMVEESAKEIQKEIKRRKN